MKSRDLTKARGIMLLCGLLSGVADANVAFAGDPPRTLRALYGLEPPAALKATHTALVLVDFQEEFVKGRLPLPRARQAIARAAALSAWARNAHILVVMVKNVAARPGSPVFAPGSPTTAFVPELSPRPGDLVQEKSIAGAFSRTTLDSELKKREIDTIIVGGFMTHLAVLTTVTDAAVLGYRVVLAADATATRALPGAGGEAGVDASTLQRASIDLIADRVADVVESAAIMALPVTQ